MKEELEDEEMEADDEEAKKRLSSAVDEESKSYSVLLLIKLIRILISFHLALGHRRCSIGQKHLQKCSIYRDQNFGLRPVSTASLEKSSTVPKGH